MSINSRKYENFIDSRKQDCSTFLWISRQLNPQLAYKHDGARPTPASHKEAVLKGPKIQELLDRISRNQNVPKADLEEQVKKILDEIGYNRSFKVIRWLGLIVTKICLRISTGIYVNSYDIKELKSKMGYCPVIFVPSHRSYADFILMSLLCFAQDVELPAIAAGMDFHGMWGMGKMLRDTGAFFMRRSYNDDSLYWTTFKQYVSQLVTKGDVPIEFFIEGTRSRSNKSISPKYGLITMVLKAFFFSEVYDILFVPVSINYDRILEESLFAFELLGVPKPKESTSGFFKSLTILSENFGDIYAHFNRPISAREFFGDKLDRSVHSLKPLHMQEVTEEEKLLIPYLAHEIVYRQQKSNVITVFNLLALILNHNLTKRKDLLAVTELIGEVNWLKGIMESFGAFVYTEDIEKGVRDSFTAHKNLIGIEQDRVCLIENFIVLDKISPSRLKGHSLSEKTMSHSVPFVMLQIYVNPTLHYLIDAAVVVLILSCKTRLSEEELFNNYHFIRSLFSTEFVTFPPREKMEFDTALQHSINLGLINYMSDGHYECGPNDKLQDILISIIEPFTLTYFVVLYVLERAPLLIEEKTIIVSVQKILEEKINSSATFVHPYCLNLDTLNNCLNSLSSTRVVKKSTSTSKAIYETKRELVTEIKNNLGVYIPKCHIEEISITPVHLQNKL